MKAIRLHSYGEKPAVESVPDPAVGAPLDVLVDVGAAGVCRTDLHIIEGQWAQKSGVALPYVIGHENAGTVREVGSAVNNVRPGDKVILHPLVTCGLCRACRSGDDVHCENSTFPGINADGGMAEMLQTNARAVVKLDDGLAPADVAALADAGLTAYHAVRKALPLLYPGAHVVMIGAGGLGHIGLQSLVALTPAEITVVDRSPEALELAAGLGAQHTVTADGGQVDAVLDITGGKGAQVVLDFVGENGTEADGVAMTRNAGSYFVIGYGGAVNVPTIDIISREINVIGNLVGSYNDLEELMTLTAQGKVSLRTRTYPLDGALDALADLDAGRIPGGRAILVP
ncbi:NAD(P)-dependent alcohol dehydrogenase [Saccharopolyspora sp. HNM0983]|uniref:NAD(P)-dependent alcohol dehydrogenase n=1 Tax=Saccharopolyspora montiporae TaxID=2781240 RepID=A0A929G248_9PSEU|nr:NAD(P)-dependent alcohol dehydrogenase [Saccharopolyspora sp. HNM0983]MBE9375383.1 NAD(P)-dependent alcohol dehydrogenase [Saccharopolyspora sp. HNM0983]